MAKKASDVIIYHNPRCTKSRQTLQLLDGRGVQPRIVEYLKTPPSRNELERILRRLHIEPRDLMRKKEALYEQLELDNPDLNRDALIQAMVDHPKLIERPIVIVGEKAALGRPPENVLEILQ